MKHIEFSIIIWDNSVKKERDLMKKIIILGICLISLNLPVNAESRTTYAPCGCETQTKCLDLLTSMYNERETMYNVLNLSADQAKCKDQIDKERYQALDVVFNQMMQERYVLQKLCEGKADKSAIKKQEQIVKNCEKQIKDTADKYDHEFLSILDSEQRAKYKTVRKMAKKEINYCRNNKAFYKRDPKLRPFGQKMYYTDTKSVLCPAHKKWHLFGRKCKEENSKKD